MTISLEDFVKEPDARPKKAPSGAKTPSAPAATPVAPAISKRTAAIKQVQQWLIDQGLPVRAEGQQFADGGWGKITNDSFKSIIEAMAGESHYSPDEDELKIGKSALPFVNEDPAQTASHIFEILETLRPVLKSQPETAQKLEQDRGQTKPAEAPSATTGRPESREQPKVFWDVNIVSGPRAGTYSDVLISTMSLSSPANLEEIMIYKGMVDPASRGKDRAEQVVAAINGMMAALPEKFPGAKLKLQELGMTLQRQALQQSKAVHVRKYLEQKFAEELFKMPEPMKQSALYAAEHALRRKNVLDEDGYLKFENAADPYTQEIENMFNRYLRRAGT